MPALSGSDIMKGMEQTTRLYLPKWASALYALLAIVLIPWIFDLAQTLPTHHIVRHWDAVWVGFDILMVVTTLLTVWFFVKKRIWVIVSATMLATLLIVDSWFDILTAKPGGELQQAIFFGAIELILALFTFRLVYLAIIRATPQKKLHITSKKSLL